jgi:glycosyltransferase involved in cell wall biosynthesis
MIHSLSIVYPMFNEKDNIGTAVAEALRVGPLIAPDIEVIVVDDASTDGSGALLDRLAAEQPLVRAIHHRVNRKLGGALKSGFAAATKEWILYMDSDLPIRMDDALNAVPLAERADVVIGWRKSRAESWRRSAMSWVYNRMIRLFFGLRVRDVNFAFKLFRRSFYERALLTSEGSFIDAELLLELQREGARFAEIGMDYHPRVAGESTLAGSGVVLTILSELYRYRVEAHGKAPEDFGGERRRLWLERADQLRHRGGVSPGSPP